MGPVSRSDVRLDAGAGGARVSSIDTRTYGGRPVAGVSVVIPAWNAAGHIRRAMESVLRQTVRPREVIVVDDGSSDNTAALVAEYGSVANCLRRPHQGLSVARNEGIAHCGSDWIAFLDADDEWLPTKLERQVTIVEDYPDLRWCSCRQEDVKDGRALAPEQPAALKKLLAQCPVVPYVGVIAAGLSLAPSGVVVQRALLCEIGGFDPSLAYSQDRDLWLRIALQHPWLGYSPEVGLHYYADTPGSLTKRSRERSEALGVVCRHLEAWKAAGNSTFQDLGRRMILEYLIRSACGQISIDAETQARARRLAELGLPERLLLASLGALSAPLARKVGSRLSSRRRRLPAVPYPPPRMRGASRVSSSPEAPQMPPS